MRGKNHHKSLFYLFFIEVISFLLILPYMSTGNLTLYLKKSKVNVTFSQRAPRLSLSLYRTCGFAFGHRARICFHV